MVLFSPNVVFVFFLGIPNNGYTTPSLAALKLPCIERNQLAYLGWLKPYTKPGRSNTFRCFSQTWGVFESPFCAVGKWTSKHSPFIQIAYVGITDVIIKCGWQSISAFTSTTCACRYTLSATFTEYDCHGRNTLAVCQSVSSCASHNFLFLPAQM